MEVFSFSVGLLVVIRLKLLHGFEPPEVIEYILLQLTLAGKDRREEREKRGERERERERTQIEGGNEM